MENLFALDFSRNRLNGLSTLALAHVGDGVFDLLCRSYLCVRGDATAHTLHQDTVALVKAPAQAEFARLLLPHLTQEEYAYYRRGKNAHTHPAPKAASPVEYAMATGVEALFGALYLSGQLERLNALFETVMEEKHGL